MPPRSLQYFTKACIVSSMLAVGVLTAPARSDTTPILMEVSVMPVSLAVGVKPSGAAPQGASMVPNIGPSGPPGVAGAVVADGPPPPVPAPAAN